MTTEVHERNAEWLSDTEAQRIARNYAEALLLAAETAHVADEVGTELRVLVQEVFARDPQLEEFFSSAAISRDHKSQVIRRTFEGCATPTLIDFLLVVNQHERLELLRLIEHEYRRLLDQRARRVRVRLVSAVPLADDLRRRIADQIRETFELEPELEETVDPEVLGGLVVRVGDWLFDDSVRQRIEMIRNQIITRSSHEIQSRRDRFSHPNGN
jgi:F-type H+-transporting ATPase subunit delta